MELHQTERSRIQRPYCNSSVSDYTSGQVRGKILCHQFSNEFILMSFRNIWHISIELKKKLLTGFKRTTFFLLYLKPTSHQILYSASHRGFMLFVKPITQQLATYLLADPSISASSSCPLPCQNLSGQSKNEDKFQMENLTHMPRKCFITFKKIVKVSVKAHMIFVSVPLPFSCSFFSSFSTNTVPNVRVKPHVGVCLCCCFIYPKRTDKWFYQPAICCWVVWWGRGNDKGLLFCKTHRGNRGANTAIKPRFTRQKVVFFT